MNTEKGTNAGRYLPLKLHSSTAAHEAKDF